MQSADSHSYCYVIFNIFNRFQYFHKLQKMLFLNYLDVGIGHVEQTCSLYFTCRKQESELFQMKTGLLFIQVTNKCTCADISFRTLLSFGSYLGLEKTTDLWKVESWVSMTIYKLELNNFCLYVWFKLSVEKSYVKKTNILKSLWQSCGDSDFSF